MERYKEKIKNIQQINEQECYKLHDFFVDSTATKSRWRQKVDFDFDASMDRSFVV